MAGFIHSHLRVPPGILTDGRIPLIWRLYVYLLGGPTVNYVSSHRLAQVLGLDVGTPEKAEYAAKRVRDERGALRKKGLLEPVILPGGQSGDRVVIPDAPQACLDMLSSLDSNVYQNPSASERGRGRAPSTKLPDTRFVGWDQIPWLSYYEDFKDLLPFAFSEDVDERRYFWRGYQTMVRKIIRKTKTRLPPIVVSMLVFLWTVQTIREKGYPPAVRSRGGYLLKSIIAAFPLELLRRQPSLDVTMGFLRDAKGSSALRAYLKDGDETKVPPVELGERLPDPSGGTDLPDRKALDDDDDAALKNLPEEYGMAADGGRNDFQQAQAEIGANANAGSADARRKTANVRPKTGTEMQDWDVIPLRVGDGNRSIYHIARWACDPSDERFDRFWTAFRQVVVALYSQLGCSVPANCVSMMLVYVILQQYYSKGRLYPSRDCDQVDWLLKLAEPCGVGIFSESECRYTMEYIDKELADNVPTLRSLMPSKPGVTPAGNVPREQDRKQARPVNGRRKTKTKGR